ncbi:Enolase-phosphatase E1 [Pseudocercospora fuligena]|uniref:Enolase-phosphatase E1 n=1 Tax=Pseudocercospora fuligena TaxID=685502 RepID=A0A8H6VE77_9PEZI|nr:Enolase-phosphatase E1 [Pseudocercospora fuligena]
MEGVKCILFDIEGTVCSIAFVKDTLFPYAIKALPQVLATKWEDTEFATYRDAFPEEHRKSPGALQAHVEDLTKQDVKIAYLKNLQGYLWETGYKTGAYGTELFPDVVTQLRQWRDSGFELAIYSSGSIFAQKLLFGHVQVASETAASSSAKKRGRSVEDAEDQANKEHAEPPTKKQAKSDDDEAVEQPQANDRDVKADDSVVSNGEATAADAGKVSDEQAADKSGSDSDSQQPAGTEDLTHLFEPNWFDTTNAGLKTESTSYSKIAEALKWKPEEVLFLSDNVKEVDAAIQAGMKSIVVDRPGNAPLADADKERLEVVTSLADIHVSKPR